MSRIVATPARHPRGSRALGRRLAAGAAALVALGVMASTQGGVEAAFQATTSTTGNTVGAAATFPRYTQAVAADSPSFQYRLNERPLDGVLADATGSSPGRYPLPYSFGIAGATGDGNHALGLHTDAGVEADIHSGYVTDPQVFTEEVWFRTTTTAGGKIIGFSDLPSGASNNYDRHVYMLDDGRLTFGIYPGYTATVTTTGSYNDGSWHLVDASVGAGGMELYVDGVLAASDPAQTVAQNFDGYWRVGGDNLAAWSGPVSNDHFDGDVDEVAVYSAQLPAGRIAAHHAAAGSGYAGAVLADNPYLYWRLADSAGAVAADASGNGRAGTIENAPWQGPSAVTGATADGDSAAHFTGVGSIASPAPVAAPSVFSEELWFRTTTTTGGKLLGFGIRQAGDSTNYDRHVYMQDDGKLSFGVNPVGGAATLTTATAYNDGAWHHVVATSGTGGVNLYVDGGVTASNPLVSGGEPFTGYWRVGGDNLGNWPSPPSTQYFTGDLDDVAVYPTELSAAQVAAHHTAAAGSSYAAVVLADAPDLYWRLDDASLDPTAHDSSPHGKDGLVLGAAFPFSPTAGPMRAGQASTTAVHFAGNGNAWNPQQITAPQVFTVEFWLRTRTVTGGEMFGFGQSPTGASGAYDRHVYMADDGRITFGVYPWALATVTTTRAYNDGSWHLVDATFGPAGIKLYVDGRLQAADPSVTVLYGYSGYWRIGGDTLGGWTNRGTAEYFTGDLAEVAVYPTQLDDEQVRVHYYANH